MKRGIVKAGLSKSVKKVWKYTHYPEAARSDVPLVNSDIDLAVALHLSFEAIAVFIKNQIHTALFIAWFFKKAAFFLLRWILGRADGHPFFFAIIFFRTTHQISLLRRLHRTQHLFAALHILCSNLKSRNHANRSIKLSFINFRISAASQAARRQKPKSFSPVKSLTLVA